MPRRVRKRGRLIQKRKPPNNKEFLYRVLAQKDSEFWVEREFSLYEEAKKFVDNIPFNDIEYQIYSNTNRVLYTREGK